MDLTHVDRVVVRGRSGRPVVRESRLFRLSIEDMRWEAARRGGKCLSPYYQYGPAKLEWECAKGHRFERVGWDVRAGRWCSECEPGRRGREVQLTVADMQVLAKRQGGRFLSREYVPGVKLDWQCRARHRFELNGWSVRSGKWCPHCSLDRRRLGIAAVQKVARARGGACLSRRYVNKSTKLRFRCARRHSWDAVPGNVLTGSWCPACAGKRQTIEDMQRLARKSGGRILSRAYLPHPQKMEWRCGRRHRFWTTAADVKNGRWCPFCSGHAGKSIAWAQALARKKGGRCLSSEYLGNKATLRWECARKHTWEASPNAISSKGTWCPRCSGRVVTIDDLRELAGERSGEFLSAVYKPGGHKHRWRCREGHEWMAVPSQVRSTSWCPVCAVRKRVEETRKSKLRTTTS